MLNFPNRAGWGAFTRVWPQAIADFFILFLFHGATHQEKIYRKVLFSSWGWVLALTLTGAAKITPFGEESQKKKKYIKYFYVKIRNTVSLCTFSSAWQTEVHGQ